MAIPALLVSHRLDELFDGLPPQLSVAQLSKTLGIDIKTGYRWLTDGVLPGYKLGERWIILRDEVRDHVAKHSNQKSPSEHTEHD